MRPLVILDENGELLDAALMNEKGFRKSLENRELWVLHPETGRLLPRTGLGLVSLEDRETYYAARCEVPDSRGTSDAAHVERGSGKKGRGPGESARATGVSRGSGGTRSSGVTRATGGTRSSGASLDAGEGAGGPGEPQDASVIDSLWRIIRKRNAERPEGSYTTYLFEQGIEKIRKKTGEEAVELVLAAKPSEIASESADLVYHLLVLLEATGIGLEPVLEELAKRAK